MKHAALWTVVTVAVVGVLLIPASARAQCCAAGAKTAPAVEAWTAGAKTLAVKTPEKPKVRAKGGAKKAHASAVADLAEALRAIDRALAAIQAGNSKAAVAQLHAAKKLVTVQHTAATRRAGPPKKLAYANTRCPIMGGPVKPGDGGSAVYDGKKVGFCCPGCITAWNRLTDSEKAAKLAKAKAKAPK